MVEFLLKQFKKRFGRNRHYYRILDEIFGLYPHNIELYKLALIHRSASQHLPDGTTINNERLEFLGDAVLQTIVTDYMFVEFPEESEGFLTKMRSKIVSRTTLNDLCVSIGLAEHIILNRNGSFVQKHLYGDAMEAMIGAIYLDKGYNYVNRLIINGIFDQYLDLRDIVATETDFKSRLIEWCQKSKHTIHFTTVFDSTTPYPHVFRSVAVIDGMEVGHGLGDSKKEAEQRAAYSVSQILDDDAGDAILDMLDDSEAAPLNQN